MLPEFYNQLVAMHGTVMIFLAVVPLAAGAFGTLLVPRLIGAGNMALPRTSALAFWLYAIGGLVMVASFFVEGGAANSGWTSYPPLSILATSGQTWWLAGMVFVSASATLSSVSMITTIVRSRAPGVTLARMPFFVWSQLVTALLLLLAFPALQAAAVFQLMDRVAGTSFFLPSGLVLGGIPLQGYSGGGSPLLWQHLFWFLAHPEVYVLILPAMGIVSEVIVSNTRRPLWGYGLMVAAVLFLGGMSMLVWAHHMFLTGMGITLSSFFQITTMIVSIPSVVLITALVLSLWGGSIRFPTAMLFALAFLPMFGIGGLTGLPLGLAASDITLHDTYYVVAHFHYLVAPGTVFALFAGIYHWFPAVTGRTLSERLGKWHFWLSFFLMNNIFLPMFFVGLAGVNRRLYDAGRAVRDGAAVYGPAAPHDRLGAGAGGGADPVHRCAGEGVLGECRSSRVQCSRGNEEHGTGAAGTRHRTLAAGSLAGDVLRFAALGVCAAAGRQCGVAAACQRLGTRRRWRGVAGRRGPVGAADARRALRLCRVSAPRWSCGCRRCTTRRSPPGGRPPRISSSRRGSRSPVCSSPSSPSSAARRRGVPLGRFATSSARARGFRIVWGSLSLIWLAVLSAFSLA